MIYVYLGIHFFLKLEFNFFNSSIVQNVSSSLLVDDNGNFRRFVEKLFENGSGIAVRSSHSFWIINNIFILVVIINNRICLLNFVYFLDLFIFNCEYVMNFEHFFLIFKYLYTYSLNYLIYTKKGLITHLVSLLAQYLCLIPCI